MHSTQTLLRAQRGAGEATNREEIKKAISQNGDAVALLAHASHELSLFRRSSIRPSLEQGYSGLCSDKVPVTKFLFGDNLADSMKEVQETSKLCSRISPNMPKPLHPMAENSTITTRDTTRSLTRTIF